MEYEDTSYGIFIATDTLISNNCKQPRHIASKCLHENTNINISQHIPQEKATTGEQHQVSVNQNVYTVPRS